MWKRNLKVTPVNYGRYSVPHKASDETHLLAFVLSIRSPHSYKRSSSNLTKRGKSLFGAALSWTTSPFFTLTKSSAARGQPIFFLEINFYNGLNCLMMPFNNSIALELIRCSERTHNSPLYSIRAVEQNAVLLFISPSFTGLFFPRNFGCTFL